MLISFTVTAQLICAFVFAYAKSRVSHDVADIVVFLMFLTPEIESVISLKLKRLLLPTKDEDGNVNRLQAMKRIYSSVPAG